MCAPNCGGKTASKSNSYTPKSKAASSGGYRPKTHNPFGGSFGVPKVKGRFGSRNR